MLERALVDLHLRDSLPLAHGDEPRLSTPPTTQIEHEAVPVTAQSCQDGLQSLSGELAFGEDE